MSETKKPKLSEIRASLHWTTLTEVEARENIAYLLDLVERLGKVLYHYRAICLFCKTLPQDSDMLCYGCEETRALLKELER